MLAALLGAGAKAVRAQKALMQYWENHSVDAGISAGIEAFVRAYETDEPRRMLSAFGNRKRG
jgi:hypothetical protein